MIPKVYFQFGDLQGDVWCAKRHLKDRLFRNRVIKQYPGLSKLGTKQHRKFYLNEYKKNSKQIFKEIINFQKVWDKINDKFMKNLSRVLETKVEKEVIIGAISVHPISPRDWRNWRFSMPWFIPRNWKIFTTAHEIIHMFYFKKLIDEFPKKDQKQFDSRTKEWKLSEVLANVIINDPRISNILGIKTEPVRSYVCSDEIAARFNKLYLQHLKEKTSFVDFYKKARKLANKLL